MAGTRSSWWCVTMTTCVPPRQSASIVVEERGAALRVEPVARLIQDEQLGVEHERASEEQLPELPVRERVDAAAG